MKQRYTGGLLGETRHLYYSVEWQVLEERLGTATMAERQVVWGLRYLDDLVLRDRDVAGLGILSERLYGLQDPNWNVTALAGSAGEILERYVYDGYGVPAVLTPLFGPQLTSLYDWETRYAGYRWDDDSGLHIARNRFLHGPLGCWIQRDPLGYLEGMNLYCYANSSPLSFTDPKGESGYSQGIQWGLSIGGRFLSGAALAAALKAFLIGLGISATVAALAVACAVPSWGYWLVQMFRTPGYNDKWLHCVASCQEAKLCSSSFSWLFGRMKEYILDWILGKLGIGSGVDPQDLAANDVGLACAGALSWVPVLSWLNAFIGEDCRDCCSKCYTRYLPGAGPRP
jgi:RHS repeat-associated protein